jgi:hypothetical protein
MGRDPLSESIINFKNGNPEHVQAWIDCAVRRVRYLRPQGFLLVRALRSSETTVALDSDQPLDRLGQAIAAKCKATWLPQLLTKSRPTQPLHTLHTRAGRLAELDNVYQVDGSLTDLKYRRILVLDDVVTTGVTARCIIRALKAAERSMFVMVFSLARTDYDPLGNQRLALDGEAYKWADTSWIAQEPAQFYLSKLLAGQDKHFDYGDPDTYVFR